MAGAVGGWRLTGLTPRPPLHHVERGVRRTYPLAPSLKGRGMAGGGGDMVTLPTLFTCAAGLRHKPQ